MEPRAQCLISMWSPLDYNSLYQFAIFGFRVEVDINAVNLNAVNVNAVNVNAVNVNAVNVNAVDDNNDDEKEREDGFEYDREIWDDKGVINGVPTLWCKRCRKSISKTQQLVNIHLSMDDHKKNCGQMIIDID